jgi:hypothetical protein
MIHLPLFMRFRSHNNMPILEILYSAQGIDQKKRGAAKIGVGPYPPPDLLHVRGPVR